MIATLGHFYNAVYEERHFYIVFGCERFHFHRVLQVSLLFLYSLFRENQGSGQQCCYGDNGNLLTGSQRGAGSVDRIAPVGQRGTLGHFRTDVLPYMFCCWGEFADCEAYHEKRPADNGEGYRIIPPGIYTEYGIYGTSATQTISAYTGIMLWTLGAMQSEFSLATQNIVILLYLFGLSLRALLIPPTAFVIGDPHIVTLDGLKYTFNGKGEFVLIETVDANFALQGRMVDATDQDGNPARATIFSAIAARQSDSATVQFEISRRGLDALVDGERVEFEDLPVQTFNNVTVRVEEGRNDSLSASFSSGARMQVRVENDILSVLLVSLPDTFQGRTRGLMGNFNGDTSDDLQPRVIPAPIPASSPLFDIHFNFGVTCKLSKTTESLILLEHRIKLWTYINTILQGLSPIQMIASSHTQLGLVWRRTWSRPINQSSRPRSLTQYFKQRLRRSAGEINSASMMSW